MAEKPDFNEIQDSLILTRRDVFLSSMHYDEPGENEVCPDQDDCEVYAWATLHCVLGNCGVVVALDGVCTREIAQKVVPERLRDLANKALL